MSDAAVAPLELERWFVSCRRPWRCDLSASAAAAPTLAALLALAAPDERAAFHEASLDYGPPDGCSELRELIASRHTGTSPTDVVVTAGATQALHLAITCLLDPGDEIVVQWPTYPAIAGIAETHGAVVRLWQTDDAARPDLRTLEHLLTPRTRVVAITQPTTPTGTLFCDWDLVALLALADAAG